MKLEPDTRCARCDRAITPAMKWRKRDGALVHADCERALRQILDYRKPNPGPPGLPRLRAQGATLGTPRRFDEPALSELEASRIIENGRRKPRVLDEPSPGRAGGGSDFHR